MTIGERIKFFRKSNNIKQYTFALLTGISQTHVSKIENNQDNPSDKLLRTISAVFHIRYEWLKYETGEMMVYGKDKPEVSLTNSIYAIKQLQEELNLRDFDVFLSQINDLIKLHKIKFENFKYFDCDKISGVLFQIQQLFNYLVDIDKKYGALSRSDLNYEECESINNDIYEIADLYLNNIASNLREYIPMLIASWDVIPEHIFKKHEKGVQ